MVVMTLVAASCAGSDSGPTETEVLVAASGSTDATSVEEATDVEDGTGSEESSAADAEGSGEASSDSDVGDGMAVVTVGDTRFEFTMGGPKVFSPLCSNLAGAVQAFGVDVEGRDITVDIWIPPNDWETYADERYDPPRIVIKDDENVDNWVANVAAQLANPDTFAAGSSQVDDYVNDGFRASGTATFLPIRQGRMPEGEQPVEGSFEVECPEG